MKLAEDHLENARVMVVRDGMLDRYWNGSAARISPEALASVVRHDVESELTTPPRRATGDNGHALFIANGVSLPSDSASDVLMDPAASISLAPEPRKPVVTDEKVLDFSPYPGTDLGTAEFEIEIVVERCSFEDARAERSANQSRNRRLGAAVMARGESNFSLVRPIHAVEYRRTKRLVKPDFHAYPHWLTR